MAVGREPFLPDKHLLAINGMRYRSSKKAAASSSAVTTLCRRQHQREDGDLR
jgi:hypothetical protein